ncbi:MAG: RidA family protein [Tagaea sp.]|nr:RidA family protein [Tagaea sp.]
MARRLISSGSEFEKLAGYSRAVVDGKWIFVSGTTGFDYAKMSISADVAKQTEQCFANIKAALAEAGATLGAVVRVRVFVASVKDFKVVAPILGKHFAKIRPANTSVVTGFIDPRIKVEIEVTAKKRGHL